MHKPLFHHFANDTLALSMALIQNVALLPLRQINLDKINVDRRRRFHRLIGGSFTGRGGVQVNTVNKANSTETVNGKKVNGALVDETTSFLEQRNKSVLDVGRNSMDHEYLVGRFVEGRYLFRQAYVIRSYEIGPDKTATMETIMNLLQETALNHVASSGLAGDGFGATREMSTRKLIWVVTRIHVQIDKYSSWGDVVEVDTWVDAAGKNGMRRDWIVRDYHTRKIITKATSTWVTMNRETRRLSKIPDEVRNELVPFYINRAAMPTENIDREPIEKLTDQTADNIRKGLAPRWSDMDANQHVNNVKYIGWILESMPINVLQDYNMTSLTLEYRRECRLSNVLESLTGIIPKTCDNNNNNDNNNDQTERPNLECTSLLRMEGDHADIVRARSVWKFHQHHIF